MHRSGAWWVWEQATGHLFHLGEGVWSPTEFGGVKIGPNRTPHPLPPHPLTPSPRTSSGHPETPLNETATAKPLAERTVLQDLPAAPRSEGDKRRIVVSVSVPLHS